MAVNLTVVRKGGTLGVMTLDWVAMLDGKCLFRNHCKYLFGL